VRQVIGERLIDEVETAHREVVALLEIWQEYRQRSDSIASSQAVCCCPPPPLSLSLTLASSVGRTLDRYSLWVVWSRVGWSIAMAHFALLRV
jgi:hypothetical protein